LDSGARVSVGKGKRPKREETAMSEGLRLEDWIGERVTVNVYGTVERRREKKTLNLEEAEVESEETEYERSETSSVVGSLEGLDPHGIIVLYDPRDQFAPWGRLPSQDPHNTPRHALIPWHRVSVIERIETTPEPE